MISTNFEVHSEVKTSWGDGIMELLMVCYHSMIYIYNASDSMKQMNNVDVSKILSVEGRQRKKFESRIRVMQWWYYGIREYTNQVDLYDRSKRSWPFL